MGCLVFDWTIRPVDTTLIKTSWGEVDPLTDLAVALVLGSVLLHVAWNAAARQASGDLRFMWLMTLSAGIFGVLVANRAILTINWGVAWPYLVGTSSIHAIYFVSLGRSYRHAELSWAYSTARGLGLLLTSVGAYIVWHQNLNAIAWIGIMIVATGVILLGWQQQAKKLSSIGTVALMIAGYSLVDSHAMSLVNPIPYVAVLFLGAGLLMSPVAIGATAPVNHRAATISGLGSMASYTLMLMAYRLGPVAPLLALRQWAPGIAAVWGIFRLRERGSWKTWSGIAMTLTGGILAVWR